MGVLKRDTEAMIDSCFKILDLQEIGDQQKVLFQSFIHRPRVVRDEFHVYVSRRDEESCIVAVRGW